MLHVVTTGAYYPPVVTAWKILTIGASELTAGALCTVFILFLRMCNLQLVNGVWATPHFWLPAQRFDLAGSVLHLCFLFLHHGCQVPLSMTSSLVELHLASIARAIRPHWHRAHRATLSLTNACHSALYFKSVHAKTIAYMLVCTGF